MTGFSESINGAPRRRKLVVLATGGTIASTRSDTQGSMQDYSVTLDIESLLPAISKFGSSAELHCINLFSLPSHDIENDHLLKIGRVCQAWLDRSEVDGLIITHGTDSLEETAYFLNLTIRSEKPVVVTGAMRPSDHPSPDGPANLIEAVAVASSPMASGKGVLVVLNDCILEAGSCSKQHTTGLSAFDGISEAQIGEVIGDNVLFRSAPTRRHTAMSEFTISGLVDLPTVDVIYDHQSARSALYEASIASGCVGIVVAGMGNGSLSAGARVGALHAKEHDTVVVRASRCGYGRVTRLGIDDELLTVPAGAQNPQKARILLMVALAHGVQHEQLARLFVEY